MAHRDGTSKPVRCNGCFAYWWIERSTIIAPDRLGPTPGKLAACWYAPIACAPDRCRPNRHELITPQRDDVFDTARSTFVPIRGLPSADARFRR